MPVAPTYPGVYVEELPSGVHTISGVSTSVTAFVGFFARGDLDIPTRVLSIADVERSFGPLLATSEAGYGIRQFFANGGSQAWVVRVASGSPAPAEVSIKDRPAGTAMLKATAASAGGWGDSVRLAVDYASSDPATRFNLTVSEVDANTPPTALTTETYRNLTLNPADANYAVDVVNNSSSLVRLSLIGTPAATALPTATGTTGADISSLDLSTISSDQMTVTLGGTDLTPHLGLPTAPTSLLGLAGALQAQLRSLGTPPAIPSATVSVFADSTGGQHLLISAALAEPHQTLAFSGALAGKLGLSSPDLVNVQQYALGDTTSAEAATNGVAGGDGGQPDAAAIIGAELDRTGLAALATVDFNILCLPDVMNLGDTAAAAVLSAAETVCQGKWAFLVVDPPQSSSGGAGKSERDGLIGIQSWLAANSTLRSTYAAVYYPRPQVPDPLNGFRLRPVAASGTVAGLYARTDSARGVWKAPAGTEASLANVAALSYDLTDAQNGVLNPLAINCLRSLPVYGNVCWGARTLAGADQIGSQWKYIPVRRLALYIEASLFAGTQWAVFEPNDEPLWSQIRLNVGTFMQQLFRQGAFQGTTPQQAYFVRCDSTTTTQADIDLGVVNIVVGFAPLKPAEFVVLQIQQIAGQSAS